MSITKEFFWGVLSLMGAIFIVAFIIGFEKIAEELLEGRKKRGAIRCPKCGREMKLIDGGPNISEPLWFWNCGSCDHYVPILPKKFKRKRERARYQLRTQGFTFLCVMDGKEEYIKKGYRAYLDWTGKIDFFDEEVAKRLANEGSDRKDNRIKL